MLGRENDSLPNSAEHGHTLLREFPVVARHNAYHTNELDILWPPAPVQFQPAPGRRWGQEEPFEQSLRCR